jgi:TonB family protein
VPSLDESALETVRRWQFNPARRGGVPVSYEFRKPIEFTISRRR